MRATDIYTGVQGEQGLRERQSTLGTGEAGGVGDYGRRLGALDPPICPCEKKKQGIRAEGEGRGIPISPGREGNNRNINNLPPMKGT